MIGGDLQSESHVRYGAGLRLDGLMLAAFAGVIYALLRPPLFNYDGYIYRLNALQPFDGANINPHHLLWYPLQILIRHFLELFSSPSPAAFQRVGLFVNCVTVFLFYGMIRKTGGSRLLAAAFTLFLAFSPQMWFMGMQNQPYPWVFLLTVAFLHIWFDEGGKPPRKWRLVAAGLTAVGAAFLQQAMIVLIPAGTLALWTARRPRREMVLRGLIWASGTAAAILLMYVTLARLAGVQNLRDFSGWTSEYLKVQHSIQFHLPQYFSKSLMGISRSIVQIWMLEDFLLDRLSAADIYVLYGGIALAACLAAAASLSIRKWRAYLFGLLRQNALFAVCVFFTIAWALFVLVWEPTGYYWVQDLFPVLICLSILLSTVPGRIQACLAVSLLVLSGWNIYAGHARDKVDSINSPEQWVSVVHKNLAEDDILIILGKDWFAGMDYGLISDCLDASPPNPVLSVLDDFILKPGAKDSWPSSLRAQIESALQSGRRVLVADHVFEQESYEDLPQAADPFSEYTHEEYLGIDAGRLRADILQLFKNYRLKKTNLRIGPDLYWQVCK